MRKLALAPEARCQSAQEWLNWLQCGQQPRSIASRRRNTWLWIAGGGIAMAAFACWYTTRPGEPGAPALPAAQSTQLNDEDFYRHVCTQLGLDELVRLTQDNIAQRQELKKRHKQQRNAIVQQMRDVCAANIGTEDKRQQFRELEKQYKALKKEQRKTIQELERQALSAAANIQDSVYEPDSKYPWSTQEEYLALRRMQPKLEKQYLHYASDYYTSLVPSNEELFDEAEQEIWQMRLDIR